MARQKIQAPKGVSEYFPPRSKLFEFVRQSLIAPARSAGYQLMELPVFEDTITLRPEGTAGAMRAVIEHGLDRGALPVKIWYSGAYFRAERPQAGRYRQFYQVGIEAIGLDDPAIDAEVIAIADAGFKAIGLKKYRLEITSLGDAQSRAAHRIDLMKFIATLDLDEATAARAALNPLRLFDDKREEMRAAMLKAPLLMQYLSDASRAHFESVKGFLDALGISYVLNPRMVRGLDYYTGTTFEFVHELLGAQSGIGGGGRYDGLMHELGGQELSGIGFGLGVDRALLAAEAEGVISADSFVSDLFIIPLGDSAMVKALGLAMQLRNAGKVVEIAFGERALKGAMKAADKSGAHYVVVLGDNEIATKSVELKNMNSGVSTSVTIDSLINAL